MDKYQEYANIKLQIKDLELKEEILKKEIVEDMLSRETDSVETEQGKFSFRNLKKWKYSEKVAELEEDVKVQKAKEEENGEATCTESKSLAFTSRKEKQYYVKPTKTIPIIFSVRDVETE